MFDFSQMSLVLEFYDRVPTSANVPFCGPHEDNSEGWSFSRLGRAFSNVCDDDSHATDARFALWGGDIFNFSDWIEKAIRAGDLETALRMTDLLKRNARAFVDCCNLLDSTPSRMQFTKPQTIFSYLKEHMEANKLTNVEKYAELYQNICELAE